MKVAPEYIEAIKLGIVAQLLLGLFASMNLGGPEALVFWALVALVYWLMTTVLVIRQPEQPGDFALQFVKYGYPLMFVCAMLLRFWR